jgi:hypothetical protein
MTLTTQTRPVNVDTMTRSALGAALIRTEAGETVDFSLLLGGVELIQLTVIPPDEHVPPEYAVWIRTFVPHSVRPEQILEQDRSVAWTARWLENMGFDPSMVIQAAADLGWPQ